MSHLDVAKGIEPFFYGLSFASCLKNPYQSALIQIVSRVFFFFLRNCIVGFSYLGVSSTSNLFLCIWHRGILLPQDWWVLPSGENSIWWSSNVFPPLMPSTIERGRVYLIGTSGRQLALTTSFWLYWVIPCTLSAPPCTPSPNQREACPVWRSLQLDGRPVHAWMREQSFLFWL